MENIKCPKCDSSDALSFENEYGGDMSDNPYCLDCSRFVKGVVDYMSVENFTNEYDYDSLQAWIADMLNGRFDLELMKKAVLEHSVGNFKEVEVMVLKMFNPEDKNE